LAIVRDEIKKPDRGRTMDQPAPMYRLVVFDVIDADELPPVRELFCRVTGLHPTDATQWIARTPGVWPRPLPEDQARALLDGLYDLQVAAEAWRADQFPDLSKPRTIHDAACLDSGLRIKGLRGEPTHWVPWNRVELISAGWIEAEDAFRGPSPPSWTSALSIGLRALTLRPARAPLRPARAVRVPRDPIGEVIIVRRDPRLAFRIVANQMNYASLGDRLRPSAAENFPIFLAALCAFATEATLTSPTRAMLEGRDPAESEFPSTQALLDYSTHRLLWSWYSRDRDARYRTESESETET
jgi:hypothetical protein